MSMKVLKKILFSLSLLVVIACKSYVIPTESFREQMVHSTSSTMKKVEINNPLTYSNISYTANAIEKILVLDENGNPFYLKNSPSIEMKVTHTNGKKYNFYFDTVILENDSLKGGRSRYIQSLSRAIPMDSIVKIQVKDSGKKMSYQ